MVRAMVIGLVILRLMTVWGVASAITARVVRASRWPIRSMTTTTSHLSRISGTVMARALRVAIQSVARLVGRVSAWHLRLSALAARILEVRHPRGQTASSVMAQVPVVHAILIRLRDALPALSLVALPLIISVSPSKLHHAPAIQITIAPLHS